MNILKRLRDTKDHLVKDIKANIADQKELKRETQAAYKEEFRKSKIQTARAKGKREGSLSTFQRIKENFSFDDQEKGSFSKKKKKRSVKVYNEETRTNDFRKGNIPSMFR